MKSPPPLNLGGENLRGDTANQGMGAARANHSSAVSSCYYPARSTLKGVSVRGTLTDMIFIFTFILYVCNDVTASLQT